MSRASTANRSKRGSSRGSSRGSNNGGKRGKLQVEPNMGGLSGGPLSPSQKAAILAEAMLKEEEEVAKHRIGAVYADPEVRRRLANGRGPMIHALMLEQQYHNLLDERQEKRERARMFRRQVGRFNGPDRNVLARSHEVDAEAVSDLLSGACADVFPNAQQTYPNQDDHSIGRDTVPVRYGTAYNSHGGSLNGGHHGGLFSHRSKHGAHHTSPIAPPVREIGLYDDTCWWYSLCTFQYRQH